MVALSFACPDWPQCTLGDSGYRGEDLQNAVACDGYNKIEISFQKKSKIIFKIQPKLMDRRENSGLDRSKSKNEQRL